MARDIGSKFKDSFNNYFVKPAAAFTAVAMGYAGLSLAKPDFSYAQSAESYKTRAERIVELQIEQEKREAAKTAWFVDLAGSFIPGNGPELSVGKNYDEGNKFWKVSVGFPGITGKESGTKKRTDRFSEYVGGDIDAHTLVETNILTEVLNRNRYDIGWGLKFAGSNPKTYLTFGLSAQKKETKTSGKSIATTTFTRNVNGEDVPVEGIDPIVTTNSLEEKSDTDIIPGLSVGIETVLAEDDNAKVILGVGGDYFLKGKDKGNFKTKADLKVRVPF